MSYVARALQEAGPDLPFPIVQQVFAVGSRDQSFSDGGVQVTVFRNENTNPHPMAAVSEQLWRALPAFDVIHVHQAFTFFGCYCVTIARSLDKTLVLTDLGGGENSLLLERRGIALADGILSISRFAKSLIDGYFNGLHSVVVGPVDTIKFHPPATARQSVEVLGVGRLLPHKGFDRIIDALPPDLPLTIVGRPYDSTYYGLLRSKAARKTVRFVIDANDADLLECYHKAGLYVHASTFVDCFGNRVRKPELMGLTTLEALATGLPVAVADTGSLPELANDARFGLVFGDDSQLRMVLDSFSRGQWPSGNVGALARDHAVENYAFPVAGRRIAEFYAGIHCSRDEKLRG